MPSLRARLRMLGVESARPDPVRASGFIAVTTDFPLPAGLTQPIGERALARMGADFAWPDIRRVLFMDTETTGLARGAGTIAFLLGAGYGSGDVFRVEQFRIGDYPDEPEMLHRFSALSSGFDALVTFNGRAFDVPLLEARYTMNRMREDCPNLPHLDLLHPARRLWRRRLGSVKLSVLEENVLMAGRTDDLPGSEAPRRFFDFLKTGDESLLEPVMLHNRLDVRALAVLLTRLCAIYENPEREKDAIDLLCLGKTLEKRGELSEAMRLYHQAALPKSLTDVTALRGVRAGREAEMALSLIQKRQGEREAAAKRWEKLAQTGDMGARPMLELAKYAEHVLRDHQAALGWTECALVFEENPARREALEYRRRRLLAKLRQTEGTP